MGLYFDVHCHLDSEKFEGDLDEVLLRAKNAGFSAVVTNGLDGESNRKILKMAAEKNALLGTGIVRVALGIYPLECLKLTEEQFENELNFMRKNRQGIVGIGEVGIDYHWDKTEEGHEKQKKFFRKFISLSKELDLPLIVHSRDAEEDTINILMEENAKKVVMHCFGGSNELAKRAEKNKWLFSIPANIMISGHFQKLVKELSLSSILTETDAPYLAPERGKINEPLNIVKAVKKIAEIKGITEEETQKILFSNFQRFF